MAELMGELQKTCIVISGPTAVGKTGLSIELAGFFNAPVLSFDSRQCYRELNIGVAKPPAEALATVPHYFIDSHSVYDDVNAAVFARYADEKVAELFVTGNVLIMVGGTGLYLDAFLKGLDEMPAVDPEIRQRLRSAYQDHGLDWLRTSLIAEDPLFTDLQNPQRMLRALEIKLSTGISVTAWQKSVQKIHPFKVIKIALDLERPALYDRINQRVDQMIEEGLYAEVEALLPLRKLNALNTVGYKELFEVIAGKRSKEDGIAAIKQHTRNYAKRQLTWFRRDEDYHWFAPSDDDQIKKLCLSFLDK